MARNGTTITLDTRVLDRMIRETGGNVAEAVAKTAISVEARAKVKVQQMDAIDTGALLSSIYTELKGRSDYDRARAEARARRPGVVTDALPQPQNDHTAHVGPSVEYGAAVEFGSRNMPGRPFLLEAVRQTERDFRENLSKAVKPK